MRPVLGAFSLRRGKLKMKSTIKTIVTTAINAVSALAESPTQPRSLTERSAYRGPEGVRPDTSLPAISARRSTRTRRQQCQRSRTLPARLATSPAAMRARSSDEAENVSGHLGPVSRNCRSSYGEVTELIINAAITHRAIVETTLADKYCPRLRKEERAVLRALSFLGGGSLKQSESFQGIQEVSEGRSAVTRMG